MKKILFFLLSILILFALAACSAVDKEPVKLMPLVEQQMSLGPRIPGSEAHAQFITQTVTMLESAGWAVQSEAEKYQGKTIRNITADRGQNSYGSWIVIGAHYDSRIWLPHSIFICTPLMSLIFSRCSRSLISARRARSMFLQFSRFWKWLRSTWLETTMPVGL